MLTTTPKVARRKIGGAGDLSPVRDEISQVPGLSSDVAACLGERLRAYYSHLMNAPVPDSFNRILEAIDRKERTNDDR